jgi:hypothetical protein
VTAAPNIAPIIAAVAARARRRVSRAFREMEAFGPDDAIPYEPGRLMERRYFAELIDYGAIVEAAPDTYYLDEDKLRAHTARRRKRALALVGAAAAIGAAIFGISRL